jgi:thioredoxin
MEMKQFILIAPPGVGGKDHAASLARRWQIPHVSMEELLQQAVASGSDAGLEARPYVEAGERVPDEVVLQLMRRRFEQMDTMLKGWVLDGFPRTLTQAQGFNEWWESLGQSAPTAVYLKTMQGILMNRLVNEPGQTGSAEAIRRRLEHYQAEVEPILEYYQRRNQLKTVNASVSFAEVARDLANLGHEPTDAAPLIRDEAELDVLIYSKPRLVVDCMASWCGSCQQVTPFINRLAEEYRDRVNVMKLDFDANRQISKRFGLKGIPAVLFFKDGQLLETLTGVKSYNEYNAALNRLLD